ncbi:MAG: immune inhibitor A, partial [Bacteroidia bacterium]|nr:immune inhibitor A [Bacteroidia bacterium]
DCNDLNLWTGDWSTDYSFYYSANASITDSPFFSEYPSNSVLTTTMVPFADLTDASAAFLTFYASWFTEPNYDYVVLEASTDEINWTPLCGKYSVELNGIPVYTGRKLTWVKEEILLSQYAGQQLKLRFKLISDPFVEFDGFHFDDVLIVKVSDGTPISNSTSTQNFKLYPNPTYGKVTFSFGERLLEPAIIQILTPEGKFLQELTIPAGNGFYQWDTEHLPSGLYLVRSKVPGKPIEYHKLIRP